MDTFQCIMCGAEHSLAEIEPSFDRPDAYFGIPADKRARRTWNDDHFCVLWETERSPRRHFLRVLLPIPIRGEKHVYCWGVWSEVSESAYAHTFDTWTHAHRARTPAFPAQFANALPGTEPTLGLPGFVQLSEPGEIPRFTFAADVDHPVARQQREGVFRADAIEWASRAVHLGRY